jgi:enterochelin esterase-like enzyme
MTRRWHQIAPAGRSAGEANRPARARPAMGAGLLVLAFLISIPAACAGPPTVAPTATPDCREDGVIQSGSVGSPTQGFPIRYQVYLPPCYEEQTWASYPVLYLIHGRGGAESSWNALGHAAEIANRMIRGREIPPFILITPYNSAEDRDGTVLIEELLPHIDQSYRTLTDRRNRVLGGSSRGGVVAARMAFRFPELFGSVGTFAGGVVEGDQQTFRDWIGATPPQQWPRVLIDIGDQDLMMGETERMTEILDEWGVPYTLNIEPGDHSYLYWSGNMEMYLLWYAEDW